MWAPRGAAAREAFYAGLVQRLAGLRTRHAQGSHPPPSELDLATTTRTSTAAGRPGREVIEGRAWGTSSASAPRHDKSNRPQRKMHRSPTIVRAEDRPGHDNLLAGLGGRRPAAQHQHHHPRRWAAARGSGGGGGGGRDSPLLVSSDSDGGDSDGGGPRSTAGGCEPVSISASIRMVECAATPGAFLEVAEEVWTY